MEFTRWKYFLHNSCILDIQFEKKERKKERSLDRERKKEKKERKKERSLDKERKKERKKANGIYEVKIFFTQFLYFRYSIWKERKKKERKKKERKKKEA